MALFLGQLADRVRESERVAEVREGEGPLETLNAVPFHESPVGDLRVKRSGLVCCDARGNRQTF